MAKEDEFEIVINRAMYSELIELLIKISKSNDDLVSILADDLAQMPAEICYTMGKLRSTQMIRESVERGLVLNRIILGKKEESV